MGKFRRLGLVALLFLISTFIYCQQIDSSVKKPLKVSLHSITEVGAVIGENDDFALSLQVVNGLSFKNGSQV